MRLVRSLLEGVDVPTEIVVVCDGCRDGTEEALRGEVGTSIVVLSQPRGGPGAARNLGAAGAQAPTLLFLDDDMRAGPGLVRRHVEAQRRIGGGLVLGALPVDDASPASYLTEGLARWAARRDERLRAPGTVPGFGDVLTGNLSVARASFERLGGFDAAFTDDPRFGDEDLELGFRAIAAGERVAYAPDAIAWQTFDKTFHALARDVRRGAAADARFAAKHPGVRAHLLLGRRDSLPPWERRALAAALASPRLARVALGPAVIAMEQLRRLGARGQYLEAAHAIVRAGLYGVGLAESSTA
jgi:GT2 family glycosyltransferase